MFRLYESVFFIILLFLENSMFMSSSNYMIHIQAPLLYKH